MEGGGSELAVEWEVVVVGVFWDTTMCKTTYTPVL